MKQTTQGSTMEQSLVEAKSTKMELQIVIECAVILFRIETI